MNSETREWLKRNMRARWQLVVVLIGVASGLAMHYVERAARRGGWWPDDYPRQFLIGLTVVAAFYLVAGVVALIGKRILNGTR